MEAIFSDDGSRIYTHSNKDSANNFYVGLIDPILGEFTQMKSYQLDDNALRYTMIGMRHLVELSGEIWVVNQNFQISINMLNNDLQTITFRKSE
jgi:hypothetical protein